MAQMKMRAPLSEEEREQFLERIRDGEPKEIAARAVGSTSSRFRSLIRRDEEFRRCYIEALEESGRQYDFEGEKIDRLEKNQLIQRLFEQFIVNALDPESGRNGAQNRVLLNLCTLLHPTFKPFLEARLHRHIHSGAVGLLAQPRLDTAKWTPEQHQRFIEVDKERNELIALAEPDDPRLRLQMPALPEALVVDGDYEEVSAGAEG